MKAMKNPLTHRTSLLLSALALLITGGILYAGPLDPPAGPVTSTYKTIGEIEPRVAINAANTPGDVDSLFKITQPGSYYLTGNILGVAGKHGIKIALGTGGGQVSIDMKGHTLKGVPGSLNGYTDIDPDAATELEFNSSGGSGVVTGWGGWGIYARASCRIENLNVMSPADGCTALTGGGNRTSTIENCKFRSVSGPALVTDSTVACVIRDTVIEGDGCNTTSLISLGGDTTVEGLTVRARNSTFSAPVMSVSTGAVWTGREMWVYMTSCTAPSSLRIGPGSGGIVLSEWDFDYNGNVFSTACIDIARDGTQLHNVRIRADSTTSAPVGIRLASNYMSIDQGLWYFSDNSVPIAVDVVGSNNAISGGAIRTAGAGIRLTGASNTVTGCVISGNVASSIIGVLISLGSTNNLVTKNEFVNIGGGTAVNNLGGSSNGVAPIATPGNIGRATNPFSNIQH